MRKKTMIRNAKEGCRGWFNAKEVPVQLTPVRWTRNRTRGVRPLKKLSPAIEMLLSGNTGLTMDQAA